MYKILSKTIWLVICIVPFLIGPSTAAAGSGCKWQSNQLHCQSGYWGAATGCVSLKNKTDTKVSFYVVEPDGKSVGGIRNEKMFSSKESQSADYQGDLIINTCGKLNNSVWTGAECDSVLEVMRNTTEGGGCGCESFNCLPSSMSSAPKK